MAFDIIETPEIQKGIACMAHKKRDIVIKGCVFVRLLIFASPSLLPDISNFLHLVDRVNYSSPVGLRVRDSFLRGEE